MKNNTRKNGMDFSTVTDEVVSKISYLVIGRILLLLAIVLALFLTACKQDKPRGDVSVVDLEPGLSNIYSPEEIYAAMERVTEYFEEEFEGCVLTNLVYDEDYSVMRAAQWAEKYGDEEAIIFLSSFDVEQTGADRSLNPGETYRDWQWILTRDKGGEWQLQTWGY